jgi:hypothetical protein
MAWCKLIIVKVAWIKSEMDLIGLMDFCRMSKIGNVTLMTHLRTHDRMKYGKIQDGIRRKKLIILKF